MSLHIEQRESEGVVILDLKGTLTAGQGDLELREKLCALEQSGRVNIILNLKEAGRVDSTGLGTLVFGLAKVRKAGGRIAVENLNSGHLELFQLTRLALTFDLFDNEQDALNSFLPDRAVTGFDILQFVKRESDSTADSGVPIH